jgi:uncharacterized membrane protein
MRATGDRIRHAVSFEVIALFAVTPVGAWAMDQPLYGFGVLAIVCATIATGWNYVYNLMFDHAMLRIRGAVHKTVPVRVMHAVLFEAGLLVFLMPYIAWYLGVSLLAAFWIDIAFAAFYVVYAFVFNWLYDVVFPIPDSRRTG